MIGDAVYGDQSADSELFAFAFGVFGFAIGVTLGLVSWLALLWHTRSTLALPTTVASVSVLGLSLFLGLTEEDLGIWLMLGGAGAAGLSLLVATLWRLADAVARAAS